MNQPQSGRVIGLGACLALVVGNLIGSGIYLLPATLAPMGWNALIGWIVTTAGALCLAHVFARLAAHLPAAGGPYAYTRAAFGHVPAFFVAWAYWNMVWLGNAAVAVGVVSAVALLMPGIDAVPGLPAILTVALVWLVTGINMVSIGAVARFQVVTVMLKLIPLGAVIVIAAALLLKHGEGAIVAQHAVPIGGSAIAIAAALTFWGFLGLESATVPAGRIADPRRTIPLATLGGTAITALLYILVSTAVSTMVPTDQLAKSPAPVAAFVGAYWGAWAAGAVAIFAAISALGALNGFVLVQGEMPWAMAEGGVFPRWLRKTSARGIPVRAHIVSSVLLTIVTLMNYARSMTDLFQFIALVSIAAGLVAYLACSLAVLRLMPREPLVWVTGPLSAIFSLWVVYGCGLATVAWAGVLLLLGLPIYWWVRTFEHDPPASRTAAR